MPEPLTQQTLTGTYVRLEPLSREHLAGLCAIGLDADLWRWVPTAMTTAADMERYVDTALRDWQAGISLPFATIEQATNTVVGSSRFGNIDLLNKRVEIGWTWIGKPWQRTAVNTEAKLLMLEYAFETLGCVRVELKTDALNERSRNAILRIGAQQEGIFRKHMQTPSGRIRDSVYFSIIDDEWPFVKERLQTKLLNYPSATV